MRPGVAVINGGMILLGLAVVGCGGDGEGTGPENEESLVGVDGGVVSSADGKATLTVPAGALASPTAITITPAPAFSHPRLIPGSEYVFEPNGLTFAVPAHLTIEIDSVPASLADRAEYVWLHHRTGDDFEAVTGEPTPLGSLQVQGDIAGFSNYAAAISRLAADLLLAGQQLDAMLSDAIPSNAIALMQTLAALLQSQSDPGWQALAQPLLDAVQTTVCNAYASAVGNARDAPVDDWGVLTQLLEPVYAWSAVAAQAGALDGCPNAPLTLDQIQTLKIGQFVDFYVSKLDPASFDQDFDRLVDEVQAVVDIRSDVSSLGLSDADTRLLNEAQLPLMDELRKSAYHVCRSDGTHDYLGRLIGAADAAAYTEDDLLEDLQYCGTQILWTVATVVDSTTYVTGTGELGGGPEPGSPVTTASSGGMTADGTITLSGTMRAFMCADASFNPDELVITFNGVEVHRQTATGGLFFPSPLELDAQTILAAAGVDPFLVATIPLVIYRESPNFGCGAYSQSLDPVELATIQIHFPLD